MPAAVRLSCEECRRRKTKCDKEYPCSACRHAGLKCTTTERQRLPRGRHVTAKHSRGKPGPVLGSRVAHLEGLVKQLKEHVGSGEGEDQSESPQSDDAALDSLPRPIKARSLLAKDFFTTLSREVAGIRDTLQAPDEYNPCAMAGFSTSGGMSTTEDRWPQPSTSSAILFGAQSTSFDESVLEPPPHAHCVKLFGVFEDRVDCLYKVTHVPAISRVLKRQYSTNWQAPLSYASSIMTLERAIYFISLCTMTENECNIMLHEEKPILIARYRASVEAALGRSTLLTNPDKLVLQAFVIYLMGLRTLKEFSLTWTLVATAVRALNALGLPYPEINPSSVGQFMLLRLQYVIASLDSQTSMDRAVPPLMGLEYFRHKPQLLNDTDFENPELPPPREGLTDMSFVNTVYEVTLCYRRINSLPNDEPGCYVNWRAKQQIVSDFAAGMRDFISKHDNSRDNFTRYMKLCAEGGIRHMELLLRRPMLRSKDNPAPPDDKFDVLSFATECMEHMLWRANDSAFAPWVWFSKSWPRWHILAILLAELCMPRKGERAEKAYTIAKQGYTYCEEVMDCPDLITVWEPIKRLMARVHQVRTEPLVPRQSTHMPTPSQSGSNPATHLDFNTSSGGDITMAESMTPMHEMQLTADSMLDPSMDFQNDTLWMNWESFLEGFDDTLAPSLGGHDFFLGTE